MSIINRVVEVAAALLVLFVMMFVGASAIILALKVFG